MPADPDPDRDVREAIVASLEEWNEMASDMQDWYRWLVRSSEAS